MNTNIKKALLTSLVFWWIIAIGYYLVTDDSAATTLTVLVFLFGCFSVALTSILSSSISKNKKHLSAQFDNDTYILAQLIMAVYPSMKVNEVVSEAEDLLRKYPHLMVILRSKYRDGSYPLDQDSVIQAENAIKVALKFKVNSMFELIEMTGKAVSSLKMVSRHSRKKKIQSYIFDSSMNVSGAMHQWLMKTKHPDN